MEKPWDSYKSLQYRSLYKNKYLKGRNLTASQIADIMRRFKYYVDRIDLSPIGLKVRMAESLEEITQILDSVFNNEWKGYIKDNYKDMPYYFSDFAEYMKMVQQFMLHYRSGDRTRKFYWPDGTLVTIEDFSNAFKVKHNHIKLTLDGSSKVYSGSNALIEVFRKIGYETVSKINLSTSGLKLLVRYVPFGQEAKYMEADDGWYLCTSCDTKVKLRLIKFISVRCHKQIEAELV